MTNQISIIVPIYNGEKTLKRCVASLLAQTHENLEIILVNDGSRDRSLEICRDFAREDSRIRVIDKPNGGVSSARNAGLDAASGDYILFCDSDDWAEPDWCRCLLANYSRGDLPVCRFGWGDTPEEPPEAEACIRAAKNTFLHRPEWMCVLFNKIFSAGIIREQNLRFHPELSLGEDFIFNLEYLCHCSGEVCYLSARLYNYDPGTNGLSQKVPGLSQCDLFGKHLIRLLEQLEIRDDRSLAVRDRFVLSHFDRFLARTAGDRSLRLGEKWKTAGAVAGLESFRTCRAGGPPWESPVVQGLYKNGRLRLLMVYLILRSWKYTMGR